MHKNSKMRNWILFSIVVLLTIFFILFFRNISYFLFPTDDDRFGELVKLLFTVIGGVCLLYGLYISNRRAKATEESVKIQGEQIELALKSQIDERFKNAIEHLGSDKEPIILGSIAELHQIGKEDSRKYAEVVFNILCSYIRTETNIYKKTASEINVTVVNTIITYLFAKGPSNIYRGFSANLSSSNLANQNLSNCDLTDADLSFCYLGSIENSILDDVNLSSVNIYAQSLKFNRFENVKTFHTKIVGATLTETIFFNSIVGSHRFSVCCLDCKFENVSFDDLSTFESIFIGCTFYNCTFSNAAIIKTCFYGCRFVGISFDDVDTLYNTDFSASTFFKVNMKGEVMDLVFKGCSIDRDGQRHLIKNQIEEQKDKELNPNSLGISVSVAKNCIFGKLNNSECEAIVQCYEKLDATPQFPLGKNK